jgi:carboxyl-terminal processing protease
MAYPDNVPAAPAPSSPSSSARKYRILLVVALLLALCAGFAGGFSYADYRQQRSADTIVTEVTNTDGPDLAVDFGLFWQVWERLHEKYVDPEKLDAQKLVYGAIAGMVESVGDPYTVFLEPVQTKEFQEEVGGAFSGVGMELGMRDGAITVIAPLKDTPAFRAGILAGDVILEVDGQSTEGWTVEEAVSHIRGKRGTVVHLTIWREGATDTLEFSLTRDTIRIPAVEWRMLPGDTAYIQVSSFNGNVEDEFATAARGAIDGGAKRIIVDLRNNPGGFLDAAVNLAGWMLPSGSLVVQEKFSDGTIEELRTTNNARLAGMPVIVLINGGSASASEILAGALHDIRNIRLVGEKSFGKGSVQQLEGFYNGSSLKVTIAKWLTPNGVDITANGIAPTDEVVMDPDKFDEEGWEFGMPGKDPQLDRAIEIIQVP